MCLCSLTHFLLCKYPVSMNQLSFIQTTVGCGHQYVQLTSAGTTSFTPLSLTWNVSSGNGNFCGFYKENHISTYNNIRCEKMLKKKTINLKDIYLKYNIEWHFA